MHQTAFNWETHSYTVAGTDLGKDTKLSAHKQFIQFVKLREVLVDKFVGYYVPPLPTKSKSLTETDIMLFLDLFIKQVS